MTHILSLVSGSSLSPGLSRGATPSCVPSTAFADLLAAPAGGIPASASFAGAPHPGGPAPAALPQHAGLALGGQVATGSAPAKLPAGQGTDLPSAALLQPVSGEDAAATPPVQQSAATLACGRLEIAAGTGKSEVEPDHVPGRVGEHAAAPALSQLTSHDGEAPPVQPQTVATPEQEQASVAPAADPAEEDAAVEVSQAPDEAVSEHRSEQPGRPEDPVIGPALPEAARAALPVASASTIVPTTQAAGEQTAADPQADQPGAPADERTASERPTGTMRHDTASAATGAVPQRPAGPPEQSPGGEDDFTRHREKLAGDLPGGSVDGAPPAGEALSAPRLDGGRTATTPAPMPPTIPARPGEIGRELGLEVARSSQDGRDEVTIQLDPVELGRIHIRLRLDEQGSLRAHVAAESSLALDMLRRDSGELVRALNDAGVRADAQSFQFDARGQDREPRGQAGRPPWAAQPDMPLPDTEDREPPRQRRLHAGGTIDLFA